MFKKLRKNEKGFTLAELLIVVAIIGVLVAISIPIFTAQLEKAREGADLANIRAAYAEAAVNALDSSDYIGEATTDAKMQSTGAIDKIDTTNSSMAGIDISKITITKGSTVKVEVNASDTTKDPVVTLSGGATISK